MARKSTPTTENNTQSRRSRRPAPADVATLAEADAASISPATDAVPRPQIDGEPAASEQDAAPVRVETPWPPATESLWQGRYQLQKQLGFDAFGASFEAFDTFEERAVEVIVFHPVFGAPGVRVKNLERLERTLAFTHPHLGSTFDVAVSGGLLFAVVAPRVGTPLAAWRRDAGTSRDAGLRVFAQFMSAIGAIHDAGAVHGAVQADAARVVVDQVWLACPWWLDAAGAHAAGLPRPRLTWMAPELLEGQRTPDVRSDIYGLGLVFGFLLARGLTEPAQSLASQGVDVPEAVDAVYLRATALEPGKRFATVPELRRAVEVAFGQAWNDITRAVMRPPSSPPRPVRHDVLPSAPPPSESGPGPRPESTVEDDAVPADVVTVGRPFVHVGGVATTHSNTAGTAEQALPPMLVAEIEGRADTLDAAAASLGDDGMPPPPPLETGAFEPPPAFDGPPPSDMLFLPQPLDTAAFEPPPPPLDTAAFEPPPPPSDATGAVPVGDILAVAPGSSISRRLASRQSQRPDLGVASDPTMDLGEFLRSIQAETNPASTQPARASGITPAARSSGLAPPPRASSLLPSSVVVSSELSSAAGLPLDDDDSPPVGIAEPTIIEGFSPSLLDDLDIFRQEAVQSSPTFVESLPAPPPAAWNDSPFAQPTVHITTEPPVTISSPTIVNLPGPASRPTIRPSSVPPVQPDFAGVLQKPLTRQGGTKRRRPFPIALIVVLAILVSVTIGLIFAGLQSEPVAVAGVDAAGANTADIGSSAEAGSPDAGGTAPEGEGADAGSSLAAATLGEDGLAGSSDTVSETIAGTDVTDEGADTQVAATTDAVSADDAVVAGAMTSDVAATPENADASSPVATAETPDAGPTSPTVPAVPAGPFVPKDPNKLNCPGGMGKVKRKLTVKLPDGKDAEDWEVYCIDRFEFPGGGSVPQVNVDLGGARGACAARKKRLCTKSEWRRGCGGTYPYGRDYIQDACHLVSETGGSRPPVAAGSKPQCKSWLGAMDMVGNVAEWAADGTVNGGSSYKDGEGATCNSSSKRVGGAPYIGFRCCADPE